MIFDYSGSGEYNPSSTSKALNGPTLGTALIVNGIAAIFAFFSTQCLLIGSDEYDLMASKGDGNDIAVVYSTEHLRSTVDQYSVDFLGRRSDPDGNDYWVGQLQHGARDEQIVALIGSDEYFFGV